MNTHHHDERRQPISHAHYLLVARQERRVAIRQFAASLRRMVFRKPKNDQAALEIDICGTCGA